MWTSSDVDVERGVTRLDVVAGGAKGASRCGACRRRRERRAWRRRWWSEEGDLRRAEGERHPAVKRSVLLDDLGYSIGADRVKVQRAGWLGVDVADLPLMP